MEKKHGLIRPNVSAAEFVSAIFQKSFVLMIVARRYVLIPSQQLRMKSNPMPSIYVQNRVSIGKSEI